MAVLQYGSVRKLTPREVFRLFGIDEEIIDRLLASGISDTQLYRAAGDSVVVPVIEEIAKNIISISKEKENKSDDERRKSQEI